MVLVSERALWGWALTAAPHNALATNAAPTGSALAVGALTAKGFDQKQATVGSALAVPLPASRRQVQERRGQHTFQQRYSNTDPTVIFNCQVQVQRGGYGHETTTEVFEHGFKRYSRRVQEQRGGYDHKTTTHTSTEVQEHGFNYYSQPPPGAGTARRIP